MEIALISVVVPIHNEAGNIQPLHAELEAVLPKLARSYEIIYVNDGSTDASARELAEMTRATVITLRRRYGQATALSAGFAEARGDIIVSIDGDGQNDPSDIERLLKELESKDLDVIAGWRVSRSDTRGIRILTRIGRAFRRALISDPVHDTGCTLRVYRSDAAKSISISGEMHRYILALLRWKGFTIGELPVTDRIRVHGTSKYGYAKAARGLIDLIYIWFIHKYSDRPLHLFGFMSLGSLLLGSISLIFTLYDRLFRGLHVNHDGWFFLAFFFLIGAITFFSFGIVIDLLMHIYLEILPSEKQFYVKRIVRL